MTDTPATGHDLHWVMVVVLVSGLLALARASVRAAIEDRANPQRAET